jgi:hypothetical protein
MSEYQILTLVTLKKISAVASAQITFVQGSRWTLSSSARASFVMTAPRLLISVCASDAAAKSLTSKPLRRRRSLTPQFFAASSG